MTAFPDWKKYIVPQRRPNSGCIPTGYEIILRAAQVPGIDFDSFQEEFDLDKGNALGLVQPKNNFFTVADAIKMKYPFVKIEVKIFNKGEGVKKLQFIEDMISQQRPILISLSLKPFGRDGWHIMVVVDSNDDELCLLRYMSVHGQIFTCNIKKVDLARIHDNYDGGNDVAYLTL
ncbi:MAG: hypothetical protein ACYC36_10375 [Bellilinea sp.]